MRRTIALLSGPVLFSLCLLVGDESNIQVKMIAVALWMLSWWISSALPIGVTALLPLILFPMLDILDLKATAANYAHPVIYLFLGGFILGLAIEKWMLHKRIALNILRISGEKPVHIILGCMLATSLLSMWISNTATTVMMLPIGMSIISLLGNQLTGGKNHNHFALSILIGIAYAANIGGVATLIGTPPNLVLAGMVEEAGLESIAFSNWFFFAMPLVVLLFLTAFLVNTKLIFPIKLKRLDGVKALVKNEIDKLGKFSSGEKRVLIILVTTALLWVFRGQLSKIELFHSLSDTIIAIIATFLLFIVPSAKKKAPLLIWEDTKRLPWGILLLFGGGLSLAKGLSVSKIVNVIGDWISAHAFSSTLLIILTIVVFSVFLTEIMSNVALVAVFIPISFVIAQNLGLSELQLAIPLTIGASCAFMFPISTPPNAVVFASGEIKMGQMAKTGLLLNILCIAIISAYCYYVQGYYF
jgi:sodium-dependent dicarboxylate transporter 2/3/5